mgnify:CR=1 FL=1|tara:strand:- start:2209 stop:4536 length:2328 start_codon:yes stop_codon:yes gene_type:complete
MNIKKIFLLIFASLLFYGQNIDFSDLELTPENLQLLESLPPNVKQRIFQEYSQLSNTNTAFSEPEKVLQESSLIKVDPALTLKVNKFGYDFFDSIPTTSTPINDVPIPGDYLLGTGDVLEFFLRGDTNNMFKLPINKNGSITFPQIGDIVLINLTLDEARLKISQLIDKFYFETEVQINIAEVKFIQVYVVGAVKNPGAFLVNPFTSISNMIALAGGIRDYGSLRNIELRRKNFKSKYDLYDLIIFGNRDRDSNLRSGDTIFVSSTENFIEVSGAVNRPAIYEIKESDSLKDVVAFAQGFTTFANKENLQLTFLDGFQLDTKNFSINDEVNLDKASRLFVSLRNPYYKKDIFVNGAVLKPGPIELEESKTTLKDIISKLEFAEDVYPFFSLLKTYDTNSFSFNLQPFSILDPESYEGLDVFRGSEIFILSNQDIDRFNNGIPFYLDDTISNFIDLYSVQVSGLFKKNGKFPVYGRFKLKQIIEYVGGILPTAQEPRVEFITPFNNLSLINPDLENVLFEEYLGSYIFVNGKNTEIVNVTIEGEVVNPGTYAMLPGSTLEDLYQRAGGLRKSASVDSILFTRQSVIKREQQAIDVARENLIKGLVDNIANVAVRNVSAINSELVSLLTLAYSVAPAGRLAGDLAPNSDVSKELVLNNGDRVQIFSKPQTVSIAGEINSPLTVYFDENYTFNEYINLAGGYTNSSDKNRIYIIKSNGTAFTPTGALFSFSSYIPEPGDTIIVPKKLLQLSGLPLVESATNVLSSIAFSAASLNALRN